MNRREFAGFAALVPMIAAAANRRGESAGKPSILIPDESRVHDIGHGEAHVLVSGEQSGNAWWLAEIRSDPNRKTSLHVHLSADEYIYVLEGTLAAWVEGAWRELPAGGVAAIPQGSAHALGNRGERSMRYLVAGTPAGFERFFADIELLARQFPYGSAEFLDQLGKVYKKYDSKLLGPPPPG